MPKEIVLDITTGGQAEGLHFDQFDLGFLGKQTITRASEILFHHAEQLWGVWIPGESKASATGFSSYETAREFEVAWLQECRKQSIDPRSHRGLKLAEDLRSKMP